MSKRVPVLVLRAAGINCDEETMHCWRLAGAEPSLMHVNALLDYPKKLDEFTILTIPGGFAYGDDIAAGVILAQKIQHRLADTLTRFVDRGGGIFGICNGFQVLVKMGLLPGGDFGRDQVTLTNNNSSHFEARWVRLQVCTIKCPFVGEVQSLKFEIQREGTRQQGNEATSETPKNRKVENSELEIADRPIDNRHSTIENFLELPVEHAEGQIVTTSEATTRRLFERGQVALRYVDAAGQSDRYPANPNGSVAGIAGLCDSTGRVFGLMPHPDRHFDHTQHPQWTRRNSEGPPDGLRIFLNAVRYWKDA
ncbi:MAG: phosphoribosylformylglycinamidine synthase subunit PurQ [Planctomycetes bacterium]|nr:phosphoribosylformylglycinamidine synthase subunit PurQ [Planctomycetota bacterium]MBI3834159.1 phosphoribosylformylglycinamidine synthase subunit PurQ [Planctomycetota bacterium]